VDVGWLWFGKLQEFIEISIIDLKLFNYILNVLKLNIMFKIDVVNFHFKVMM
jgi:hypothetical protein